jgi:hypothetical protein
MAPGRFPQPRCFCCDAPWEDRGCVVGWMCGCIWDETGLLGCDNCRRCDTHCACPDDVRKAARDAAQKRREEFLAETRALTK